MEYQHLYEWLKKCGRVAFQSQCCLFKSLLSIHRQYIETHPAVKHSVMPNDNGEYNFEFFVDFPNVGIWSIFLTWAPARIQRLQFWVSARHKRVVQFRPRIYRGISSALPIWILRKHIDNRHVVANWPEVNVRYTPSEMDRRPGEIRRTVLCWALLPVVTANSR